MGVIVGTATVASGGINVTWTGATLTAANCKNGFPVVINGQASFVDERLSTTVFSLLLPVDVGTGLDAAISSYTSQEMQIATLNARAAEVGERLSVLDANGRGLFYNLLGTTGANDPGPTFVAFDSAVSLPEDITEIYLDVLDANNLDVSGIIDLWPIGTVLTFRSIATNAYISATLSAAATNEGPDEWRRIIGVTVVEGMYDGLLADGEAVAIEWNRPGGNAALGNPKGAYAGGTTYSYRDMVTTGGALWIYHNNTPGSGNAPPTLPTQTNAYWQLVANSPTVQDVLDDLGINSITISTSDPSGGVDNDLWFKVPV